MDQSAQLHGVDMLDNSELQVGFNADFERRFHLVSLVLRGVMLLVVVAGLAGLLGRGPFSHATTSGAGGLTVDYEPVARYGTTTQITFHLPARTQPADAVLKLDGAFIEPMGLQAALPTPLLAQPLGGGQRLTFPLPQSGESSLIRLVVKPDTVGVVAMKADVEGLGTVAWRQVVLP